MAIARSLRSTGITPLHHYYGAVRPSPAHWYFRPRGWSRLCLVWGFACQGVSARRRIFYPSSVSLFDLKARFSVPTRDSLTSARAGAVKVGRRTNPAACSAFARPHLDSFEHDGTLGAVGMTIRGEPAFGRDQSRHNLVFGGCKNPTMMQQCASAAKLRSGGPILFLGITAMAQTGTRHLEPSSATRHKRTDWAETVGCLQQPPFIASGAGRRRPAPRPLARAATRRSKACAPRPRS
jgi:hypothetical protein